MPVAGVTMVAMMIGGLFFVALAGLGIGLGRIAREADEADHASWERYAAGLTSVGGRG